jgi:hypothetical protein
VGCVERGLAILATAATIRLDSLLGHGAAKLHGFVARVPRALKRQEWSNVLTVTMVLFDQKGPVRIQREALSLPQTHSLIARSSHLKNVLTTTEHLASLVSCSRLYRQVDKSIEAWHVN